jgi:5-methylcytosine-specific restriction endonuclease McrA
MQRLCEVCRAPFTTYAAHIKRGAGRFCSRKCQGTHRTQNAPGQDREKLLARKRRYRERHLQKELERNRAWAAQNREYLREQSRLYQKAHPEKFREGMARWKAARPDHYAAGKRACACNFRARVAGSTGHISRSDITALWERQPVCVHCGQGRGVDHIIEFRDSGQNVPDNLQNLCRWCNAKKSGKVGRGRPRGMWVERSA